MKHKSINLQCKHISMKHKPINLYRKHIIVSALSRCQSVPCWGVLADASFWSLDWWLIQMFPFSCSNLSPDFVHVLVYSHLNLLLIGFDINSNLVTLWKTFWEMIFLWDIFLQNGQTFVDPAKSRKSGNRYQWRVLKCGRFCHCFVVVFKKLYVITTQPLPLKVGLCRKCTIWVVLPALVLGSTGSIGSIQHTWYLSFFLHSHILRPGNFTLKSA